MEINELKAFLYPERKEKKDLLLNPGRRRRMKQLVAFDLAKKMMNAVQEFFVHGGTGT